MAEAHLAAPMAADKLLGSVVAGAAEAASQDAAQDIGAPRAETAPDDTPKVD